MLKVGINLANDELVLLSFGTDLGQILRVFVGKEIGVRLRGKGPNEPEFVYVFVLIHFLLIYTDLTEFITIGNTIAIFCVSFPLFKAKGWQHYDHWPVQKAPDI